MRVAMYYSNSDIRIEEMPCPEIGAGEILMRIEASSICGSDVMEWYRLHKAPLVLGHEVSGVVAKVGEGVERFQVGDRIAVSHHVPCNSCHYCLNGHSTACDTLRTTNFDPGGFAEYVRLPSINVDRGVFPLPDGVAFDEATFIEPLACVLRGQRRAGLKPGQNVLVLGSGIAGLLHVHLASSIGAGRVVATDIEQSRLVAAKRFGAEEVFRADLFQPEMLREINQGRLADLVIVATGATSAMRQALESVERGGTVLFFAPTDQGVTLPLSVNDLFWRNDTTLTTSYACSPADSMTAMELIRSCRVRVKDMISHRLSLAQTALGFKLVAEASDSLKVMIEPQR